MLATIEPSAEWTLGRLDDSAGPMPFIAFVISFLILFASIDDILVNLQCVYDIYIYAYVYAVYV